MTEQEKIIRHDTLNKIRQIIGGCFGSADGIFAGHPADEGRAKEIRKLAVNSMITLDEICEIALGYLFNQGFVGPHIKKQTEKVADFFGKKINKV
jgi:hypothetical protein